MWKATRWAELGGAPLRRRSPQINAAGGKAESRHELQLNVHLVHGDIANVVDCIDGVGEEENIATVERGLHGSAVREGQVSASFVGRSLAE